MLISTALLLDSITRNNVCTPAKLPCRRVEVGYENSFIKYFTLKTQRVTIYNFKYSFPFFENLRLVLFVLYTFGQLPPRYFPQIVSREDIDEPDPSVEPLLVADELGEKLADLSLRQSGAPSLHDETYRDLTEPAIRFTHRLKIYIGYMALPTTAASSICGCLTRIVSSSTGADRSRSSRCLRCGRIPPRRWSLPSFEGRSGSLW
jgi:hypothetical protein